MGDFIDLEDGQIWGAASWVVRGVLDSIAGVVLEDGDDPLFGAWLLDCSERGPGLASFDLRGLSCERRELFFAAAKRGLEKKLSAGLGAWENEEAFEKFIKTFRLLVSRSGTPWFNGKSDWDGKEIDVSDLWH